MNSFWPTNFKSRIAGVAFPFILCTFFSGNPAVADLRLLPLQGKKLERIQIPSERKTECAECAECAECILKQQEVSREVKQLAEQVQKVSEQSTGRKGRKIYFFVQSQNLQDLQKIKNCIQYTTCVTTEEILAGGDPKYRLHLRGSFTDGELQRVFSECPRSELPPEITVKDESVTPPKILEVAWNDDAELLRAYKSKRKNVIVEALPEDRFSQLVGEVQSSISNQDYQQALERTITGLGLATMGYTVRSDPATGPNVAVTDHETRTIRFGRNFFNTPAGLFYAARHELEHVQQMKRAEACLAQGRYIDLNLHNFRERSAYLNDALNIRSVCGNSRACSDLELNSLLNFEYSLRN